MTNPPALPAPAGKWDDDYVFGGNKDVNYVDEIPPPEEKVRKQRGRKGADELYKIVSSKMARDINRKADWTAEVPFAAWNKKDIERNDGVQRYYGRLEDYDDDGIRNEFVIRKGSSSGPVVAVNGYTTSKSDYPWRRDYYNHYPTKEERKNVSMQDFIDNKYGATYKDDNMTVASYRLDPEEDRDTKWILDHKGYTNPVPRNKTPYRVFTDIIHKLIGDIILNDYAGGDVDESKKVRKELALKSGSGMGFASILCSIFYDAYIIQPIYDVLNTRGLMAQYVEAFEKLKQRTKPGFKFNPQDNKMNEKFNAWLRSRKEFKESAKNRAALFVSTKNIAATTAELRPLIKQKLDQLKSIRN